MSEIIRVQQPTLVGTAVAAAGGSSVSYPAATQVGDLILAGSAGKNVPWGATTPSGFTFGGQQVNGTTRGARWHYRIAAGGESGSVNMGTDAARAFIFIVRNWSGDPDDIVVGTLNTKTGTLNAPTVAATGPSVVLFFVGHDKVSTPTVSAPWTKIADGTNHLSCHATMTAAGTTPSGSWDAGGSSEQGGFTLAIPGRNAYGPNGLIVLG